MSTYLRFGKYKDHDIRDVPSTYLEFLIESASQTIEDCDHELQRRQQIEESNLTWEQRIVEAGYRSLAKKHHPDHGGSVEEMQQVNNAVESLREAVRGA